VLHDLPTFVTAPLYRHWHRHWGATPEEAAAVLPGDELLPHAQFRVTRAITIHTSAEAIWPWLVQVGSGRAGWYSNDLLDNAGHPSAMTIVPELQDLAVGQWVPMSPFRTLTHANAFKVHAFHFEQWLLWTKPDSTWFWRLAPGEQPGTTRLVTRIRASYDWSKPLSAATAVILLEFGDFAMCRRMLLGIKARAERLGGDGPLSSTSGCELKDAASP
jgi:hypothetical protein